MKSELRVATVERDLLREKLKAYQRQLFAAKSEARGAEQRDLFLNEAEAAATGSEPAQETEAEQSIEVGAHECKKRGHKPLDPMLPRGIVPQQVRVIQHQRVKYACP
ncbi:transposase C of IS166 homeodomain protein [Burkholderia pseudomallei MSHR983]|nr:transposase C of IS166 homeodomain protein [Burkholderia pseudomallei MSHR305]AIP18009.1 transposase C of IS166 homeodomain protein [Burkholderia pseudomallei MSHR5855]AIP43874.1 transposase C of IS166 homeodomain protein [Burkholderia pseudomallei MSHR5848]AIP83849.1 transposase C of IS166 homeodomain protein [Burkholderia pseudomallei]EBA50561.1 PpiC-type peptidyl-prolyl cis-trans isomerase [Burkholderia pseudomallei 305]KGU58503.1 transposase C of IS166 homeodomain protein [Burkholderia 